MVYAQRPLAKEMKWTDIEEGRVNIVFGSAEQWLSDRWKKALQFGSLNDTEILVVDEVQTVETW